MIEFARVRDVVLFEDDYDSEFRYDVAPLPALAQLAPDRVVYLGTVAKTLGAGIRLGWLVAPLDLVDRIAVHRKRIGDFPSVPLQQALLSLLRDGEWDRAVRTARRRYRERDRAVERCHRSVNCGVSAPACTRRSCSTRIWQPPSLARHLNTASKCPPWSSPPERTETPADWSSATDGWNPRTSNMRSSDSRVPRTSQRVKSR
ncbi:aminotransferase class I/II-fold pyridoxal phosphate-dependent enzyme [Rhodococcus sp. 3Y1]